MLNEFYLASGHEPTVVEPAHFSITCDTKSVKLWVHWLDKEEENAPAHCYMQCIAKPRMIPGFEDDKAILHMRNALRNILDYSLDKRLKNIKDTIAKLPAPLGERDIKRAAFKPPTGLLGSMEENPMKMARRPVQVILSHSRKCQQHQAARDQG
jgi:hypothetical protein